METATSVATQTRTGHKHQRVVLLPDNPAQLPLLAQALRELAGSEVSEVIVWLRVERFHAPSSTHPPYRRLARIEARNITAERASAAEAAAHESMPSWAEGWQTSLEAVIDASAKSIAARLIADEIDLAVTPGDRGLSRELATAAAALAGRPLLLVPELDAFSSRPGSGERRVFIGHLGATHG
jgi:hypothetical protein